VARYTGSHHNVLDGQQFESLLLVISCCGSVSAFVGVHDGQAGAAVIIGSDF
jgi:hypothetical protein